LLCTVAFLLFCANAPAQTFNGLGFTGPESDGRPGEYFFYKGVEAVRKKDYDLAVQMYQVAASWAYKTAEYNLGVMYLHGEGVPMDRPRAMAWMALAAERNDDKYVDARERVYAELTPAEFAQASVIWRELKQKYGDAATLQRAKTRWVETRQAATGSHVGFVGNLAVGADDPRAFPFNVPQLSKNSAPVGMDKTTASKSEGVADGFASAAFGLTGGNQLDGTIVYRRFQLSDNPYDPIFEHGIATVGPLEQVERKDSPQHPVAPPAASQQQK
jgi:hypothetical protein